MNEKAIYEIVLKNQKFNNDLKDTEKQLNHFEGSLKDIQSTIVTAFSAGALIAFGNEAYKTSTQLQSLRNSIVFASGSSKEGAENLKFLSDISERMGLNLLATTEGFRTFSGALIGSKFEGQKARDIFEKISTGVSVMGLSADDAKGAFLALGQMVSKGTVSAEELRGQLGERLPGAFQIAARSLNVTTKQLGDMLKAGTVLTEDFLPKFADEVEKTFGGGLSKSAQSQAADMARIENLWLGFKGIVGDVEGFYIHKIVGGNEDVSKSFQTQKQEVEGLEKSLNPLVDRYKEISRKLNPTIDESNELKSIINTIAMQMPSAITAWDNYGNAIDINTAKIQKNITTNREALRILNREAIESKEAELSSAAKNAIGLKEILNNPNAGEVWKREAASQLQGLTGSGGIIEILRNELDDLKGGNRNSDLLKGVADRNKIFAGLTPGDTAATGGVTAKKSGMSSSSGSGIDKVSSATRNVNITINKLLEVNNKNAGEMMDSAFLKKLQKALLTVVNDVNIVAQ
jgi:tape measure domain-containing protein